MIDLHQLNFLLIDDNSIDIILNTKILNYNKIAHGITTFNSGKKALKYLSELRNEELPDVILLDIQMPELNGFEFALEYQKLPEAVKNKCKVFMLSSTIHDRDLAMAEEDPYVITILNKPLDIATLKDWLNKTFNNSY